MFLVKTPQASTNSIHYLEQTETASRQDICDFYNIGRVLGKGSFGVVKLANSKT